jgi:hypothetical protein
MVDGKLKERIGKYLEYLNIQKYNKMGLKL